MDGGNISNSKNLIFQNVMKTVMQDNNNEFKNALNIVNRKYADLQRSDSDHSQKMVCTILYYKIKKNIT